MSGGFLPPSPPHSSSSTPISGHSTPTPASRALLSLTQQQERRLWTHIDDRLLSLERDERKHAFGSLTGLLDRLMSILTLILQVPPVDPWGSVRVSYLLTLTGSVINYITSLPLISMPVNPSQPATPDTLSESADDSREFEDDAVQKEAASTMRKLLNFLDEVDRGWQAVLRGDAWIAGSKSGSSGHSVPVSFGSQVGATERIRLRSIIMASRSKLLAWARIYGDFSGWSYPDGNGSQDTAGASIVDAADGMDWEQEVVGLWNGTLERLSTLDFGHVDDKQDHNVS